MKDCECTGVECTGDVEQHGVVRCTKEHGLRCIQCWEKSVPRIGE